MGFVEQRWFWSVVCGVAVAVLLSAEAGRATTLRVVTKLIASAAFLALAFVAGAFHSVYGRLIFVALAFGALGDVFLLSKRQDYFKAGLFSFLAAHVCYGAACLILGVSASWVVGAGALLVVPSVIIGRWLLPKAGPAMRPPVAAYMLVIAIMVAMVFGAFGAGAWIGLPIAAILFYVSDVFVAAETFATPRLINRLGSLSLYYTAQVMFAWSI